MVAASHFFHNKKGAQVIKIGFSSTRGPCGPDVTVYVKTGAENGRVADASGNLPGQSARRRYTTNFTIAVHSIAIDGSPNVVFIDEPFLDHRKPGSVARFGSLARVEIVVGVDPPLPFEPPLP